MAYITREDGERFVIPSYRDVLSVKKQSLLKKEILLLSTDYGEYVALQRKSADQYEVAFSNEPGYLLGESVWNYFKRPQDLIYCEAIPNTSEAILVIVKSGSVYLDGSFPVDSIPEELVIFRTQQSHFDVYIYGDVPISKDIEEDKFSLDSSSVRSFTVLDKPVFETIPTVKSFQLQLVDAVLKAQGIGALPTKQIAIFLVILALGWVGWNYYSSEEHALPTIVTGVINPYQSYVNGLTTPDPAVEMQWLTDTLRKFYGLQGWFPESLNYGSGVLVADMRSMGARTNELFNWAKNNRATLNLNTGGFYLTMNTSFVNRQPPRNIYPITQVVANLIDKISYIIPGNNVGVAAPLDKGKYKEVVITIGFSSITIDTLALIGQQLKLLPVNLTKLSLKADRGYITGSISLIALGN
jgi:hypothetical protein